MIEELDETRPLRSQQAALVEAYKKINEIIRFLKMVDANR